MKKISMLMILAFMVAMTTFVPMDASLDGEMLAFTVRIAPRVDTDDDDYDDWRRRRMRRGEHWRYRRGYYYGPYGYYWSLGDSDDDDDDGRRRGRGRGPRGFNQDDDDDDGRGPGRGGRRGGGRGVGNAAGPINNDDDDDK